MFFQQKNISNPKIFQIKTVATAQNELDELYLLKILPKSRYGDTHNFY